MDQFKNTIMKTSSNNSNSLNHSETMITTTQTMSTNKTFTQIQLNTNHQPTKVANTASTTALINKKAQLIQETKTLILHKRMLKDNSLESMKKVK